VKFEIGYLRIMAEFSANAQMLNEAEALQGKTKEAMIRIQRQQAETESLAEATLEELRHQGEQMSSIHTDMEGVSTKLDEANNLQNRFDRWAGNWLGIKKRAALDEASHETAAANAARQAAIDKKVSEVFEHQKYETLSRKWKNLGLFFCDRPDTQAPDLFVPSLVHTVPDCKWTVDFSASSGLDSDGWTYANSFDYLNKHGFGESSSKWNSYVRRRKWKFIQRQSASGDAVTAIRSRQAERQAGMSAKHVSSQGEKIGFVARSHGGGGANATSTGRTSVDQDENLDEESKGGLSRLQENDKELDSMLDAAAESLDRLAGLSAAMKDESVAQAAKLGEIDATLNVTSAKQAVVNARAKRLLT
jgi:hypothetical protein